MESLIKFFSLLPDRRDASPRWGFSPSSRRRLGGVGDEPSVFQQHHDALPDASDTWSDHGRFQGSRGRSAGHRRLVLYVRGMLVLKARRLRRPAAPDAAGREGSVNACFLTCMCADIFMMWQMDHDLFI